MGNPITGRNPFEGYGLFITFKKRRKRLHLKDAILRPNERWMWAKGRYFVETRDIHCSAQALYDAGYMKCLVRFVDWKP